MSEDWDGLLPIDKPAGPTSHDLVAWVRSSTGTRRVGHTGTLDPPATGLLLLVLGRATRLARFVPAAPKTYRGEFALGVTTATDDLSGEVLARHEGPLPAAEVVAALAARRLGRQMQRPPAYSARRVGGTRLYRAARRGIVLDAPSSEVLVERLDVLTTDRPDRFTYEMEVSSGTYVRAVVRDLGEALGCGAAVASLRRTSIGPLRVQGALRLPVERVDQRAAIRGGLIALDEMPLSVPSIRLESALDAARFVSGAIVQFAASDQGGPPLVAVRDLDGRLLGVGELVQDTLLPRVVVPAAG